MAKPPTVGDILTNLDEFGYPWTCQAIALKWDTLDVAVIMAKADDSSYVVAYYDIQRETARYATFYPDSEQATTELLTRAFGM
jgi:hypothetical protein